MSSTALRERVRPAELRKRCLNRRVVSVRRRAKYLLIDLEDGFSIVVHLGMSGRMTLTPADHPRELHEHVTFGGGGVHYCLGASLARAEIAATMRQVVERLPGIELAGPPERLTSDFVNGIKRMPVRW